MYLYAISAHRTEPATSQQSSRHKFCAIVLESYNCSKQAKKGSHPVTHPFWDDDFNIFCLKEASLALEENENLRPFFNHSMSFGNIFIVNSQVLKDVACNNAKVLRGQGRKKSEVNLRRRKQVINLLQVQCVTL